MDAPATDEVFLFEGFRLDPRPAVCSERMKTAFWSPWPSARAPSTYSAGW
jgi:hypothetical protein